MGKIYHFVFSPYTKKYALDFLFFKASHKTCCRIFNMLQVQTMTGGIKKGFCTVLCLNYFSEAVRAILALGYLQLGSNKATHHAPQKTVGLNHVMQFFSMVFPARP